MKKLITLLMTSLFALSMNVFADEMKPADTKAEVKKEAPAKPAHDKKEHKGGVSFTPNTITYKASGEQAKKIKKSKLGVVPIST